MTDWTYLYSLQLNILQSITFMLDSDQNESAFIEHKQEKNCPDCDQKQLALGMF